MAGNGTVTITLNNNLTNAQVVSVIQNASGVYFQVSGYNGGAVSLSGSNATQSTNIDGTGNAVLAGAVNPTGWAAGNSGSTITVCVICAFGISSSASPDQTIIGGTGSGLYANANGSIAGNNPHNPFLAGTNTFTLVVPGVTVNSTFVSSYPIWYQCNPTRCKRPRACLHATAWNWSIGNCGGYSSSQE